MNKQIIIGIVAAVVVIGGVVVYSMSQPKNEVASDRMSRNAQMSSEEKMTGDAAMMQQNKMEQDKMAADKMSGDAPQMSSEEKMTGDAMMAKNGSYKDYSVETVKAEQKAGNKVVLFFHAQWCPDCRKADAAFKASSESIPAGVTILKIDYDTSTELKKKYAVTTQHTFVQLDANENQVTKWISGDVATLKANIK